MASLRIFMWSPPRTVSTALMRSWESRPDTAVLDEPLYAAYLRDTGREHPGREEILSHHETDWREAVRALLADPPGGERLYYQKHMAHHLLPRYDRSWVDGARNAFLIRRPREMLASLARVTPDATLEDTGYPQLAELFRRVRDATGRIPPVVDARDLLEDPEGLLRALCGSLEVPFRREMLSWRPGPRETDGVWAKHWYASVETSTGFRPYRPSRHELLPEMEPLHEACLELYRELHRHRLTTDRAGHR